MSNFKNSQLPGAPKVSATTQVTAIGAATLVTLAPRTFDASLDIPEPLLILIGKIAIHWAYAEFLLAGMNYGVLHLDRKAGRDYEVSPRLKEVTETINKIGKHRKLNFQFTEWETFCGTLTKCDGIRNQWLHAVWFRDEGKLYIQDAKGQWPKHENGIQMSKKQMPGRILVDEKLLTANLIEIENALNKVKSFEENLTAALAASPRQ